VVAGQGTRAVLGVRARRGTRRPAAGLPVHRQRSRGGYPGQAARARDDRGPPGTPDGARRELRRPGEAGAVARRVRDRRRSCPPYGRRSGPSSRPPSSIATCTSTTGPGTPSSTTSSCTSTGTCARSRTR
jgi:hypothetical protein